MSRGIFPYRASTPRLRTLAEPCRLDRETRATIESADTEVLFSAASIWEIAIKSGPGHGDFAFDPAEIARVALDTGFSELAVHANAAAPVSRQPLLHRDPFDRLLVAQAMTEPATLYTTDQQLLPYSDLVRHIGASHQWRWPADL
jgi:PIN domain nuclease of toxin-antitoxin system